jgi:glycerol uptake facilitator-like aquaporin
MVRWGWGSSTINKQLHSHPKKRPVVIIQESDDEEVIVDFKALLAEFWGVAFLVAFSAGSAVANGWDENVLVSFAIGMSVLVLSFATYHHSGAQLNPAITLAVLLKREIGFVQAIANFLAQMAGSVCGAFMIWGKYTLDYSCL